MIRLEQELVNHIDNLRIQQTITIRDKCVLLRDTPTDFDSGDLLGQVHPSWIPQSEHERKLSAVPRDHTEDT